MEYLVIARVEFRSNSSFPVFFSKNSAACLRYISVLLQFSHRKEGASSALQGFIIATIVLQSLNLFRLHMYTQKYVKNLQNLFYVIDL